MGAQDDFIRTQIRLPPALHAALKEAQQQSGRSFNAEIVARLGATFEDPGDMNEFRTLLMEQKRLLERLAEMVQQSTGTGQKHHEPPAPPFKKKS